MSDSPTYTDPLTTESIMDSAAGGSSLDSASLDPGPNSSRFKRIFKTLGWITLTIVCLLFFTILKLPEDRIRNYVQGMIATQLASQGITLTATQSALSIGFGVSYTMRNVTVNFPPPQEPVKIEQISVSPSIFPLFLGKVGATIRIENKGGTLKLAFSKPMRGPDGPLSFSYDATNMDLGSLGVLPMTAGIQGSAIASGEGSINGDTTAPTTLDGKMQLTLAKIVIEPQMLMGFSIPRLTISDAKADIGIDHGKALIRTFQIGKKGSQTDDLVGTISGDATLGRNLAYSTLNLKANFSLSQSILKAFILLDAILGPGKQADGSYAFTITGPLNSPNPVPISSGGGIPPAGLPSGASNGAPPAGMPAGGMPPAGMPMGGTPPAGLPAGAPIGH